MTLHDCQVAPVPDVSAGAGHRLHSAAPAMTGPGAAIALSSDSGLDIRVGPGTTVIVRPGIDIAIEVRAAGRPDIDNSRLTALGNMLKAVVQIATG